MSDLETTMQVRKAVAPLLEAMVSTLSKALENQKITVEKPDPSNVNITVDTSNVEDVIKDIHKSLKEKPTINIPAPVINTKEVNTSKLEKKIDNVEKAITQNLSNDINKMASVIAKSILDSMTEINDQNKLEGMPVRMINQMIPMGGMNGGSTSRNTDDRVWLRERYSYTTISGSQVVSRVEKWNNTHKLIEDYEYDANANVVVKSRALEPLEVFGE